MKRVVVAVIFGIFLTSFIVAQEPNQQQVQNSNQINTQIQKATQAENRLRVAAANGECPENCTCDGSATKCRFGDGSREMTIRAGESGNTIMQVKEQQIRTRVELYKTGDKVYGKFRNNQTKAIEILPDEAREKIQKRFRQKDCECDIELDEDGEYQIQTRKRAKLFGLIPVKEKVKMQMNSETGEITRTRTSWWGFLARDIVEESQ